MNLIDRRAFLNTASTVGISAAAGALSSKGFGSIPGHSPTDKIRLAVIGVHGRGMAHVAGFAGRKDCEVSYICDVDSAYFPAAVRQVEAVGGRAPKTVTNMKQVFDDPAVEAVVIATPDHWHALATIWA